MPIKQRKIAISLALLATASSPFLLGTYKARPIAHVWVSFESEPDSRETFIGQMKRTDNCRAYEADPSDKPLLDSCLASKKALHEGGFYGFRYSPLLYFAINVAAATGGFILAFGLVYLIPFGLRLYWGWLNR